MLGRGSEAISPTAHYTGAVWLRHGLSHPALTTVEGRALEAALRPGMVVSRRMGGPTLEDLLLARHRAIDASLTAAIERGAVRQVVELAAGLSGRGWRFSRRHGDLTYVEGDLPGMARRKRRALERAGGGPRVVEIDVLAEDALPALADTLDPTRGVAVVTEGLLNYLDRAAVEATWRRIAAVLSRFPSGLYLSDLVLRVQADAAGVPGRAFSAMLSAFVGGRVHFSFDDEGDATAALRSAGFAEAGLHAPGTLDPAAGHSAGADLVRIVDARTPGSGPGGVNPPGP